MKNNLNENAKVNHISNSVISTMKQSMMSKTISLHGETQIHTSLSRCGKDVTAHIHRIRSGCQNATHPQSGLENDDLVENVQGYTF
jgi:hypothetical protein